LEHKKFRGIAPECPHGYRPDFDFSDTSLNRHYLTKPSSWDKRGLTVVSCPDLFVGKHLLTTHARTCEWMLHHRAVHGDNCRVVCVLRTTWCSRRAAHPQEDNREL